MEVCAQCLPVIDDLMYNEHQVMMDLRSLNHSALIWFSMYSHCALEWTKPSGKVM